ncbi:MAG: ABC transporter permease subunit [Armatimonadota bacterium]|nr:ABC transporter permease subunit [Armatimonadota bacterium]MDR7500399.1 ABC transporter permease subunit [Armatimonadota bacterium]MDR7548037.1 ABC transporter permease subunit [Armatimonadota bacterium]
MRESVAAGGASAAGRPLAAFPDRLRRRQAVDRFSRRLVGVGGVAIVVSILAILVVIVIEIAPLFSRPRAVRVGTITPAVRSLLLGVTMDELQQVVAVATAAGIQFVSADDGRVLASPPLPGRGGAEVTAVTPLGRRVFALGLSDGRVIPAELKFTERFTGGRRLVDAGLLAGAAVTADPDRRPIRRLAYAVGEQGPVLAAVAEGNVIVLVAIRETRPLVGPPTREEVRRTLALPADGEITALALDERGDHLFAGTSAGELFQATLGEGEPAVLPAVAAAPGAAITALGFLIGDRTLITGDSDGRVVSWQVLPGDAGPRLTRIYTFRPHAAAVTAFAPSGRDKGFLTADAGGVVYLHYGTTGRTRLVVTAQADAISALTFAPKANAFATADTAGRLSRFALFNPHPEITLQALFGRVWYEGYPRPAYVWQSTGGTDDFEAKFSLTPLVFGTLKGTFYALLIAIPLALLGALYASQFMHPSLRALVKPVVEIMAALPSVVLGFLAGLWLAPVLTPIVPGVFLLPVVVSLCILLAALLWRQAPPTWRRRLRPGMELFLIIPLVLLGGWVALRLGGLVESALLGGDYRHWLRSALGLTHDQRNSLVVGFAMGFAVIPIIFTIAEDALSNVPPHLAAGSLALGASRWQTALRVVVPTASPGIFSAVMIGFGRAVGETMIVLMATGNTPVMDWSIFSGFRALSANIAVELPEAPHGGTLYRVLFVAALLLFVMTFIVNTAAELVRLRLRKRYQGL